MKGAFFLRNPPDADRNFLIICDHASNHIPAEFEGLGLSAEKLQSHIAYDIGAAEVADKIAAFLHCPLIMSSFSRLLIDPNRGLDDPTLIMELSDGTPVLGNVGLDDAALQSRVERFYAPYHAALAELIETALGDDFVPIILSVHSFTPIWRGLARPWQASVLWDKDARLKDIMADYMASQTDYVFGDNTPYSGRLKNDTLYRHGTQNGLPHALIELRQDEIANDTGQSVWAKHLVAILQQAIKHSDLRHRKFFGSYCDS